MRKEIIFSAKDTGVADLMSKLRQSAEELGRGLIKDSREFTTSGKEAVRYIEEQIKAMERLNKISKEEQKLILDRKKAQAMEGAKTSKEREAITSAHSKAIQDVNLQSREDEMQMALLRELIDTVKNSAREGIAEDRKATTKTIENDKRLTQLGIEDDEDEFESLKRTIQREEIGTVAESERSEKEKFDVARGAKRATDETATALSRPNEIYAIAGMLALIPIVGDGLAMLANKALGEAEARQDARSKASGRQGVGASVGGANAYGMTEAEALSQFGGTQSGGNARALGMMGNLSMGNYAFASNVGASEAMRLSMGMGVDAGSLNQLGGFMGYNNADFKGGTRQSAGGTAFDLLTRSFANTGLMGEGGQVTGNLPSLMNQSTQVLGQLTNTLDSLNLPGVFAGMAGLTKLGGSFADPEMVGTRYSQLHQGLTDTSNPFAQATKFWTMQGMNGGSDKSRFELMEQQERGMTEPGFMKNYLTKLHEMSGGNKDLFMEEIKAAFPQMSFSNTRTLAEGFLKDPKTFDFNADKLLKGTQSLGDRNFTGDLAQRTAEWSDRFADAGEVIADALGECTDAINKLISYIE